MRDANVKTLVKIIDNNNLLPNLGNSIRYYHIIIMKIINDNKILITYITFENIINQSCIN